MQIATRYRAIVFDFDLTLADSRPGFIACHHYAAAQVGLPPAPSGDIDRAIGIPLIDVVPGLYPGLAQDVYDRYIAIYQAYADEVMTGMTSMLPGADVTIQRLKDMGLRLAIVSQKLRYRIEDVLKREGLIDHFTTLIGAEDAPEFKPSPRGILLAMQRLNVTAEESMYVGDTIIDAQAARNAVVGFVGLLSGYASRDDFAPYEPLACLESVGDLPEFIGL